MLKDAEKTFRTLIWFTWITLAFYCVIKIFYPSAFEIVCNNKAFIEFGEKADNSIIIRYCISIVSSYITHTLFYLAMMGKRWLNKKELLIFIPFLLIGNIIKLYNAYLGLGVDVFMSILIPLKFLKDNGNKNIYLILLLGNGLDLLFTIISMFLKNINIDFLPEVPVSIGIIYMLDVYIMLFQYYLYSNLRKEKKKNELVF